MDIITQLGVGGIFSVMVIKMVLDFLKESRDRKNGGTSLRHSRQIGDLWEWHKPNPDGEQHWRNKQLIEYMDQNNEAIARLDRTVENNTRVMENLVNVLKERQRS